MIKSSKSFVFFVNRNSSKNVAKYLSMKKDKKLQFRAIKIRRQYRRNYFMPLHGKTLNYIQVQYILQCSLFIIVVGLQDNEWPDLVLYPQALIKSKPGSTRNHVVRNRTQWC